MATLSQALAIARQHLHAGRQDMAEEIGRRMLAAEPNHAAAWHLLGQIAHGAGQLAVAAMHFDRAATLDATNADYHNDLAVLLAEQGDPGAAVARYQRALELRPDYAHVHSNLGNALYGLGRLDEAIGCYRRAIELRPDLAQAHNNLGNALYSRARPDEAIPSFRRAIELAPQYADAHANLSAALQAVGRLDEAVDCCRRAVQLNPHSANARANLAVSLQDRGQTAEAIALFRQALGLNPDDAEIHSNLIFAMLFSPDLDPPAILDEQSRWDQRHGEPLRRLWQPHANDRSPQRRLRIGYVSADLCRSNPAGRFTVTLLEAHDRATCEVYGYSAVAVPDVLTERCQDAVDAWRDVRGVSDADLADMIRADRIDILVDLGMHTARNRLLTFARKPAPVQVSYLAYCGSTGLRAIDYWLTDPYLDPPGGGESCDAERSVRLPETYWCYRPAIDALASSPLPALEAGHVTLGCLNNSCKLSAPALAAWAEALWAIPRSRFLLHARDGFQRDAVRQVMAGRGVGAERIEFVDRLPVWQYFDAYKRIDVALDPFPYGGGTTVCDALWMGVPVVSLAGRTAVGRGGLSILSNVGLPELVARDAAHYVRTIVELAADRSRLAELRATLRQRMQDSPLMDAPRFARHVEAAYREMWHRWCRKSRQ